MTDHESFPRRLADLGRWATTNATTLDEARRRFVQYVIIECIAGGALSSGLAFKGGNALRFRHESLRSTTDLDFTAMHDVKDDIDYLRNILNRDIVRTSQAHGIACKIQSAKRNPSNPDKTVPTLQFNVGYLFPEDKRFQGFASSIYTSSKIIPIEISINDVICELEKVVLKEHVDFTLRICTLEDIIAEKLRALLQQKIRNRSRPQDVADIARVVRSDDGGLDIVKVSTYFKAKCEARDILPSRASFEDPEIPSRARSGYDELQDDLRDGFMPFDEAWHLVTHLVGKLDIPES